MAVRGLGSDPTGITDENIIILLLRGVRARVRTVLSTASDWICQIGRFPPKPWRFYRRSRIANCTLRSYVLLLLNKPAAAAAKKESFTWPEDSVRIVGRGRSMFKTRRVFCVHVVSDSVCVSWLYLANTRIHYNILFFAIYLCIFFHYYLIIL